MTCVAVIDYGMGNLHSIAKALEHVGGGQRVRVSARADDILSADRVVFPGVGAIGDCMAEIRRLGLDDVIREVAMRKPLLGICLGLQALLERSEENDGSECLGLISGEVRHFPVPLHDPESKDLLKVPHMGWNGIKQQQHHPLWKNIAQDSRFYFVHSYHAHPANPADVAGVTEYGLSFASAVGKDNIFAVQCHPEKSQHAGLQLLENFLAWDGAA